MYRQWFGLISPKSSYVPHRNSPCCESFLALHTSIAHDSSTNLNTSGSNALKHPAHGSLVIANIPHHSKPDAKKASSWNHALTSGASWTITSSLHLLPSRSVSPSLSYDFHSVPDSYHKHDRHRNHNWRFQHLAWPSHPQYTTQSWSPSKACVHLNPISIQHLSRNSSVAFVCHSWPHLSDCSLSKHIQSH